MQFQEGRLGIAGGVNDDGPRAGGLVTLVQPIEAELLTVLAGIFLGKAQQAFGAGLLPGNA